MTTNRTHQWILAELSRGSIIFRGYVSEGGLAKKFVVLGKVSPAQHKAESFDPYLGTFELHFGPKLHNRWVVHLDVEQAGSLDEQVARITRGWHEGWLRQRRNHCWQESTGGGHDVGIDNIALMMEVGRMHGAVIAALDAAATSEHDRRFLQCLNAGLSGMITGFLINDHARHRRL